MASKARTERRAAQRMAQLSAAAGVDMTSLELTGNAAITFAAAGADGKPAAGPPTFEMLAYSGGVLNVGWAGPVYVDLNGLKSAASLTILMDHDRSQIVGQAPAADISPRQVKVKGTMTGNVNDPNDPAGRVAMHARNGFQWPVSIGASVQRVDEIAKGSKVLVNGRNVEGPAYVVRAATLREVSFVSIGGDEKASARVAASAAKQQESAMNFEQWVKAQGQEISKLSDEQKATLQASYDGLKAAGLLAAAPNADDKPVDPPTPRAIPKVDASAAADNTGVTELRAEATRINAINAACKDHPDIASKAINEGWPLEKAQLQAELATLRGNRPKAPSIMVGGSDTPITATMCEAAICLANNVGTDQSLLASYGEKVLNQADKLRRVRFSKMAEVLAMQAGVALPMEVGSREWIRAAFSAADLSGILGNVANKALATVLAEPVWIAPQICGVASHSNFHAHTVYSLGLNGDFEEVGPTGEMPYLSLSEESWTRQVKTRGANLALTRTDLVNDELGVFVDNARKLVRKAMTGREKVVFTMINVTGAGTSFFTTGHKNYLSGATTVMGLDGLDAAVALFEAQTDAAGDPILITPSILLVPPGATKQTALQLVAAQSNLIVTGLSSTSAKGLSSNANTYAGQFRVLSSQFLANSKLPGYSALAWYMLANPAEAAAFEIAYLNGVTQPTIQYYGIDTNPDRLGATWQMFWDFGCNTGEYRAGVKSKGAA